MADDEDIHLDGKPVDDLRVIDLKRELDKRGLSKSGSKPQLVDRLKAQLLLEKLQSLPVDEEETVPNLKLQNDEVTGQSEFIKQYLEQQKKLFEMQREVKKRVEGFVHFNNPVAVTNFNWVVRQVFFTFLPAVPGQFNTIITICNSSLSICNLLQYIFL
ncbi:ACIN1 [Acanthosepion pharaonis]|uniref:ACIN1 n=1 Tax=Acanthosepion pharaonis TaxID=158019 RepID=A0A812AX87_ACAPH|nr:ACIN1 [Sepia pharaonis]